MLESLDKRPEEPPSGRLITQGHSGVSFGETNKGSGGELWGLAAHPSKESFATVGEGAFLFLGDYTHTLSLSFGLYTHTHIIHTGAGDDALLCLRDYTHTITHTHTHTQDTHTQVTTQCSFSGTIIWKGNRERPSGPNVF